MIPRQAGFVTYSFVYKHCPAAAGLATKCNKAASATVIDSPNIKLTTKRVSHSVLQKHFAATRAKMRSVKSGSSSIALVRIVNSNSMHYILSFIICPFCAADLCKILLQETTHHDHGCGKL